ncbi:PAS domain S-box protein [Pantoea alhagi]|uniref:PAS domain-containing sensor histidine kinase n=1 Tax=Pantoea alhagi TaxID=1891675 RepID=UPI00202B2589|nr:PAS domain S-box protein [Pantoea alhagi]URQ61333.1 PAS domain S-box protein [Pantoea alhagi]
MMPENGDALLQNYSHCLNPTLTPPDSLSSIALDRIHDAIYLVDRNLRIKYVNEKACKLMGYSPHALMQLSFAVIDHELQDDDVTALWWKLAMRPEGITFTSQHTPSRGELISVQVSSSHYLHGGEPHALCVVRDVREVKQKEAVQQLREKQFRALVENSPDMIARFDLALRCVYVNPPVLKWFEGREQEIYHRQLTEAVPHNETGMALLRLVSQSMASGNEAEGELTLTQGSRRRILHVRSVPEFNLHGELESVLTVGRDITAIRLAEEELREAHQQLRLLARNQETQREAERKHLAHEIHDELGQHLTSLRVGLSLIRMQSPEAGEALHQQVDNLMQLVDSTIQVVRDVSTRLRPNMLNLGLVPALEWLRDEFNKHNTTRCIFIPPQGKELRLSDECVTAAFRVVQESLTNVQRHAKASSVYIFVKQDGDKLRIDVVDNGKGFDMQNVRPNAWGLPGMVERAAMLNGEVSIDSRPGEGTRVQLSFPHRPRSLSRALFNKIDK